MPSGWCASRLYPDLPLREAVVWLTASTPIQLAPSMPGLPPTPEQLQQARHVAETGRSWSRGRAGAAQTAGSDEAWARDARKAWVTAGLK